MPPIPLPSHIHYELLLQLLEQQTWGAVTGQASQREQVHQLIATLRKALAQQRQLEQSCERANLPIEYRWSLNQQDIAGRVFPTEKSNPPLQATPNLSPD